MDNSVCLAPHPARTSAAPARVVQADIAVVGGGLAGSLAAVVLGRAAYPNEFRVEKLAGDQISLLRTLGLLDSVAAKANRYDEVVNIRRGRVIDRSYGEQYGILYNDLVALMREQIPSAVDMVVDRVVDVATGPECQRLTTAGGSVVEARLLVLATGMADVLRQRLNIRRRTVHEKHSISFGFSIKPAPGEAFAFPSLTCYGDKVADRVDYLNLFPVGDTMRANLFTFIDHRDPWARTLRRDPKQTLLSVMPGLTRFLGDFQVIDRVENWVMDLYVVEGHVQNGVVLIGDAFQTSCPAAGTGVSRLLTDVERLCHEHVPQWLATPGMTADKIAAFYGDRAKQRSDTRATRLAEYRRSLTVDDSLVWTLHRRQAFLRRRLFGWVRQLKAARRPQPSHPGRVKAYGLARSS